MMTSHRTITDLLTGVAVAASWLVGAGPASSQALIRTPHPGLPVYVTVHVDVTAEHTAQALPAIWAYVEAAQREPGAVRLEAVEELRPNHFDLIEVWRDQAAYQAHAASPATIRFLDAIAPWRASPFEERLGTSIAP